jgi:surface protein
MRTFTRINEDYLDDTTIDAEDISMHDEIYSEIDTWINGGTQPSFDLNVLGDAFYPVSDKKELSKIIGLCMSSYGNGCSLNWIDVSKLEDMSSLFNHSEFNGDISRWDVSHVTNMKNMFCQSWFNGNISSWDVSHVTDMRGMFYMSNFNGNISNWDVSSVEDMQAMFTGSLFNGNISDWNVSKVIYHDDMFLNCQLKHRPDRQPKFKVNEDFLDNHGIQTDSINVIDDIRAELDDWVNYGKEPSINPEILPDSFYPVNKKIELQKLI